MSKLELTPALAHDIKEAFRTLERRNLLGISEYLCAMDWSSTGGQRWLAYWKDLKARTELEYCSTLPDLIQARQMSRNKPVFKYRTSTVNRMRKWLLVIFRERCKMGLS